MKDSPAFPAPYHVNLNKESFGEGQIDSTDGLTKREWFAGLMLQGMLTDPNAKLYPSKSVTIAVGMADILIAELEKK